MNKRTDLLDRIKLHRENPLCRNFLLQLSRYYEIKDMDMNTNHHVIFDMLYCSDESFSFDEIAQKFFISTFTLDRYRQSYNNLASKLISQEILQIVNLTNSVR